MLIKPLWVTAMVTKVTSGTHRTNQRGTLGRQNTSPAKTSAQREQKCRKILHPHDACGPVGVAQGEVQHEVGQEKGDDVEIGADARHIFGIQPILGEALPEGQALVLPRQLPRGFSLLFFGR